MIIHFLAQDVDTLTGKADIRMDFAIGPETPHHEITRHYINFLRSLGYSIDYSKEEEIADGL